MSISGQSLQQSKTEKTGPKRRHPRPLSYPCTDTGLLATMVPGCYAGGMVFWPKRTLDVPDRVPFIDAVEQALILGKP